MEATSKLTSQGQVSVPAAVRRRLGLRPGSVLVWREEAGRMVVERATRHSSAQVHEALFPEGAATPAKTLAELKAGLAEAMRRRHARD